MQEARHVYRRSRSQIVLVVLISLSFILNYNSGASQENECSCQQETIDNGRSTPKKETASGVITDIKGKELSFAERPKSVVSLVPGVTEMVQELCPDFRLRGVVAYDEGLPVASKAVLLGGFLQPDLEALKKIKPDLIFVSSLHKEVITPFSSSKTRLVLLEKHSLQDLYDNLRTVGKIFHCQEKAETTIARISSQIAIIQQKLQQIPLKQRLRVLRLMGDKHVMTPGDDSFQNEAVRLAGGIPLMTGQKGDVVPVTLKQWKEYNPHYVYYCGKNGEKWQRLLEQPGWREVIAVKKHHYLSFPCNMTCRQSVHYGDFIQWLSASLYGDLFFSRPPVEKDGSTHEKKIAIDLPYVKEAKISYGSINDFPHKTFTISLTASSPVVSTLEGYKRVSCVGNHYLTPPRWNEVHSGSINAMSKKVCGALQLDSDDTALLFTGADMDAISIVRKSYKNMVVYVCTTAGVRSNAQAQSKDRGSYHPAGTINSIILTNHALSTRAMTRALITATEAKSLALRDLDVRSSYTPLANIATGTGTDNLIVIGGKGPKLDLAGGHTKIGELIAKAVYESVVQAVAKQNNLHETRSVALRLRERQISLYALAKMASTQSRQHLDPGTLTRELEHVIRDERVATFLAASFAISDAYGRGFITDVSDFQTYCREIAAYIAGRDQVRLHELSFSGKYPLPLRYALQALATGVVEKRR